jgi:putative membrane protein
MKLSKIAVALAASFSLVTAFAQEKGGPSDPQIAGIVVTANSIDIDAGKLAKSRTKNKEVSKFAQLMITDHTAVNKQAGALAKKLGVKPADSDTSKSLKAGAADNIKNLKGLKGAAFDKAYVDHEVAYHQAVLDAIDKVLIPNAKNAELKDLIVKVRPAFVAHLDHAKMVQADLAKKK